LALGGLAAVARPDDVSAMRDGAKFLAGTQGKDGSWPAATWITFPTIDADVSFGSATITTAYAVSALALTARLLGSGGSDRS
jgi:hypothetical protein